MSYYKRYLVFDLETGGTNPKKNAITEIAMIAIDAETEKEVDRFEVLIKPYDAIYEKEAAEVSGISLEMLEKDGVEIEEAFERLKAFLTKHKVGSRKPIPVGHKIDDFDMDFLKFQLFDRFKEKLSKYIEHKEEPQKLDELSDTIEEILIEGIDDEKLSDKLTKKVKAAIKKTKLSSNNYHTLDTLKMSRHYIMETERHTLTLACASRGIVIEEAHRAMPDTEANAKLFIKLLRAGRSNGDMNNFRKKDRIDFYL